MHEMVKGSNVGLAELSEDTGSVMVSLAWSSDTGEGDADVSVLLLDGNGKVGNDADFCFYNNPVAGRGSVQLLGKTPTAEGSEDRIGFDLDAVPPEVERIVVAASRYDGSRFGDLHDLRLTLADGAGEGLLRFAIEDSGAVSALIFGEIYRRSGAWKFRAIGDGYASGLAGLATDFGVDIDDDADANGAAGQEEPREAREPAAVPPPAAVPGVRPVIPAQASPPAASSAGGTAQEPPAREKRPARPRTAKKKVTLPAAARKSSPRATRGTRPGSFPRRRSRATGNARRARHRSCCPSWPRSRSSAAV